jgi:ABC-2 type transport system ATP-binding protein
MISHFELPWPQSEPKYAVISIENLSFGYRRKNLYEDFNLKIEEPGVYGLFGTNGTGKSTLLKLINGLLFARSGQCSVAGHNSSKRNPEMLEKIFLIPEEISSPAVGVLKLSEGIAPFYPKFDFTKLQELIDSFGIPKDLKMQDMSYGQKKKAFISIALASNANYLLLDEPTNGLDIPSKSQFRKVINTLSHPEQIIIISTHQVRDLDSVMNKLIFLNEGRLILNNSISHIEKRLLFKTFASNEVLPEVIYAEKTAHGTDAILKNTSGENNTIHLEVFFNAMMQHELEISAILNQNTL